ncbi:papain-like cysteine protease family protein [Micromonospora sp. M12]
MRQLLACTFRSRLDTLRRPWLESQGECHGIATVASMSETFLGVGTDNQLWTRATLNSAWVQVPNSGAVQAAVGLADGSFLGVGTDNTLWTRATLNSGWVQVPNSGSVQSVAVRPDGTFLGVGTGNDLWTRATLNSGWVPVPNSGNVQSVAVRPDGTFLGVGTDNTLWTRATLNSGWVQVPNSGLVQSAAVLADGTILGVGTSGDLWTRATLNSGWVPVPNSAPMQSVAVLASSNSQQTGFVVQRQQQTNWCWAATSVSVAAFYNPATVWTQCSMVNAELGRNDACGPAGSGVNCNKPWTLNTPLQRAGHLNQFSAGVLTTEQLRTEMTSVAPVGVRTAWAQGGAHFVMIRGRFLLDGVEYVSISDPWDGEADVSYATFLNRYKGSGTWTHTYKTRR